MSTRFIEAERACHPIRVGCRARRVPPGGLYAWRLWQQRARARAHRVPGTAIQTAYPQSRRNDGSPRIRRVFVFEYVSPYPERAES